MSSLPMEVIEVVGQTMAKVVPVTIALALVFTVLSHFWACNPGKPWWRKRELITDICYWFFVPVFARIFRIGLLVIGAARPLQHSRRRRTDRILRQWPWAAVGASALGAGDIVPRCVRLHAVLAAPHVSRRRVLEISRHPSFLRGSRVDLGGAVSSRQPVHRNDPGRRHPADRGHLSQHHAVGRAVHDLPLRLRSRQPELDAWARSNTCLPRRSSIAGITPRSKRAAIPISRAPSRSGTSCSARSACRRTELPDGYGVDDQAIPHRDRRTVGLSVSPVAHDPKTRVPVRDERRRNGVGLNRSRATAPGWNVS